MIQWFTLFEVEKLFVNVDVTKILPKSITFSKNGKEFTVEFIYPWLPSHCSLCDEWVYVERVYVLTKVEEQVEVTTP